MRLLKVALLSFVVIASAAAQSADALLSDSRLTVHTLLREDVFAGYLDNNLDRLSKAEQNIESLLKNRPDQQANLLAWKSGASLYRAVRAHEAGKPDEFERHFAAARDGFAAASKLGSGNDGVVAITGGTLSIFADRLPEKHRAAAWSQAYDNYAILWKQQGAGIENMPVHFKGEVLVGSDAIRPAHGSQRRGGAVSRQDAVRAGEHTLRGDGETVESGSRQRCHHQSHLQELPQFGTACQPARRAQQIADP